MTAQLKGDLVGIADSLADILYFCYGAAAVYGIELDCIFDIVHAKNMEKLDADGKPIKDAAGKVQKPEGWEPPEKEIAVWIETMQDIYKASMGTE